MKQVEVDIESLGYGRAAVGRTDGRVVFVEGAAPGDRVLATIERDRGSYAEARVEKIITAGASRTEAPCPIVDSCGGCPWQHVHYQEQLKAKQRAVRDTLERIAGIKDPPVLDIIPSPLQLGYRNRIKLRFEKGRLGFYSARSHRLTEVSDCLIAEQSIRHALVGVEAFVASLETRPMRVEIASGGELEGISLAINSQGRLRAADSHKVRALLADSDSPVRGVVMWAKGWRRQWGDTHRRFNTGADGIEVDCEGTAFAQVNTLANVALVAAVVEATELGGTETVLDLYSGTGNLALPLATRAARVVAVDSDPFAVETGKQSARRQNISNLSFKTDSVQSFATNWMKGQQQADRVVLDPPRSGLAQATDCIAGLAAPRLVYVSCDAATLARDLKRLLAVGYQLRSALPLDLFPHSFHVETVCTLELT